MSHPAQIDFCEYVKNKFPSYFKNKIILDCGSLDINGNNKYLFEKCSYTGIDIIAGKNVDIVSPVHLSSYVSEIFDVIISTEMLEHDKYYDLSLKKMIELLVPKGLLILTCATTGRPEHGTNNNLPECSPGTIDYYKNLTFDDLLEAIDINNIFKEFEVEINQKNKDLYFWGIKK